MSRTVRAVAVVGALLVGGAVTGTTFASWASAQNLAANTASSGTIGLTVNGTTTATFAAMSNLALNNGATPGAAQSFTAALVNTGSGKNLRMRMYVDDVTTGNAALDNGLEISVAGAASAGSCPTPVYTALSAVNTVELTSAAVSPSGNRTLCVSVRVEGGAPSTVADQDGQLTFNVRGQQVAP